MGGNDGCAESKVAFAPDRRIDGARLSTGALSPNAQNRGLSISRVEWGGSPFERRTQRVPVQVSITTAPLLRAIDYYTHTATHEHTVSFTPNTTRPPRAFSHLLSAGRYSNSSPCLNLELQFVPISLRSWHEAAAWCRICCVPFLGCRHGVRQQAVVEACPLDLDADSLGSSPGGGSWGRQF